MDIKIEAETVNKFISDAVLNSLLGNGLTVAIQKHCDEWLKGYDSPLKKVFHQVVESIMKEELAKEENIKIIRSNVEKILNKDVLKRVLEKVSRDYMDDIKSEY